jgi:hypothetical protein
MLLLPLLAFVFASLMVAGAALALSPSGGTTIERRLDEVTGARVRLPTDGAGYGRVILDALKRLGSAAPQSTNEMGKLQTKLVIAGFRAHEAVAVFLASGSGARSSRSC